MIKDGQTLEDIYIELLRYGKKHLADVVTFPETLSYLQNIQPGAGLLQSEEAFYSTFEQVFKQMGAASNRRWVLSMEGYFNLLEHDELQQARESSRKALVVAIWAIGISGILAAVSVYLQLSSAFNFWANA